MPIQIGAGSAAAGAEVGRGGSTVRAQCTC